MPPSKAGTHGPDPFAHRTLGIMYPTRLAVTPEPPYTAVIFSSIRTSGDNGYAAMSAKMDALAAIQPGFLGYESAREEIGITVSYWTDAASARAWKEQAAHLVAQQRGRSTWYYEYRVRVATVEREYGM